MDLIGEIVEHDVGDPTPPEPMSMGGFPMPKMLKKVSRWKQAKKEEKTPELTEAEKIHRENMAKISQLTEDEISQERQELLEGLDPKLIQSLLARTEKRIQEDHEHHDHAEGHDGWIGGVARLDPADVNKALKQPDFSFEKDQSVDEKKRVRFQEEAKVQFEGSKDEEWEDVEPVNDDDEIAPAGYQIVDDSDEEVKVHFPKPKSEGLDLDDPEFFEKLHEKYFPDLPKETSKLSWMQPVPENTTTTYESISDLRFDFKGNLVDLHAGKDIPTYMGLHHHSENPQLAGYTLPELTHISRSVMASQRSISIQILGRILHKLGLHKYQITPVAEEGEELGVEAFEKMMWDVIDELRIIESLSEAADEKKTRNLSVRNYATEALWLWRQGGGNPKDVKVQERSGGDQSAASEVTQTEVEGA